MPTPPRTLSVEAVVLRHSDWGEADRVLVLFTREQGKVRALAKGARKMLSRKAGHLEPFTHVKVLLAQGKDFWIVTQAETLNAFLSIRADLLRTAYAALVIELLDRFTSDDGENPVLFQLLVNTLSRIATLEDPFIAVQYYHLRLLDLTGFRPQLFTCLRCGKKIQPENQFFDYQEGGIICPRCAPQVPTAKGISLNTLKYLRHLQRSTFEAAQRAQPSPAERNEMETLLEGYFTYLLERRLNTPHFLNEIRREIAAQR